MLLLKYQLLYDYTGCILRSVLCYTVYFHLPVETLQKWPQYYSCLSVRGAGIPVWLSLSFSDSTGRWKMVSINSSEQHGWLCREESWGRGNGSMQEERCTWLWLPAATISPHHCSWCCSALMDWLTVYPSVHSYKRFLWSVLSDQNGNLLFCWSVWRASSPASLYAPHSLLCFRPHGTQSPRLVRLKECAVLIKDV